MAGRVRGIEVMLTLPEVAAVVRRPVRYVRESLVKPGILPAKKLGGNSWRVRPEALREWMESGATGARFARSSGRARA